MTDNEVKWMIVGKLLRRNLLAGVKEATMYSYNGVVLPKLPEWDKKTYPYALIYTSSTENLYGLMLSNVPFCATDAPLIVRKKDGLGTYYGSGANYSCYLGDTEWEFFRNTIIYEDNPLTGLRAFWASYDVMNYEDGSNYLAASVPVPVYE